MDEVLAEPMDLGRLGAALSHWLPDDAGDEEPPLVAAVPVPSEAEVPIDPAALSDIVGDDEAMWRDILADFVAPAQACESEILAAWQDGSVAGVGAAAHKLKSAALAVGARRLGSLCLALEIAGKNGRHEDVKRSIDELPDAVAAVTRYIAELQQSDRPTRVAQE
jgi:HPt (histidine-containing phosphotransfer) domain-containing protein